MAVFNGFQPTVYFQKSIFRCVLVLWFGFFCGSFSMAQPAVGKLEIRQISDQTYVFTTWKDLGGLVFPANGMYVVGDAGIGIVDGPWDSTQHQPLLDSLRRRHNKPVLFCLATHFHDDRTGAFGTYQSLGIPTWSSAQTQILCRERNEKQAAFTFRKDTVFSLGKQKLEVFYPGPGHTQDNVVVWFEGERILFGGCLVKSVEAKNLGNLADADLKAWNLSLKRVLARFPKPKWVIPGHQAWSGKEALVHTRKLVEAELRGRKK